MSAIQVDLGDWTVLRISGPAKKEFLNGIITYDLDLLVEKKICQTMFLTPKAKVRSIFWLEEVGDNYIVYCPPEMRNNLIEDLLKYRLNLDVKLEDITEETERLQLREVTEENPSSITFGNHYFNFIQSDTLSTEVIPYSEFNKWLVQIGASPLFHLLEENPFEVGLYNAISLDKGCFLGQEPLSRMYHRGKPRKMIYQIVSNQNLPKELALNNEVIGEVIDSIEYDATHYSLVSIRYGLELAGSDLLNGLNITSIKPVGSYPVINR